MRVLYCGDTTLDTAAAYLSGLMTMWRWELKYVPSDQPLTLNAVVGDLSLIILSDFPSERVGNDVQQAMLNLHREHGTGLMMIGGWESFCGLGGDWQGTPLGDALPVTIACEDDRVNCDFPVLVDAVVEDHAVTADLPWRDRPPLIGGFNRFEAKDSAEILLEAVTHRASRTDSGFQFDERSRHPLLVVSEEGSRRTAALATDVAPHWVGPLVDWGDSRVGAQAAGGEAVEVGDFYAQFFQQLLEWTAGKR